MLRGWHETKQEADPSVAEYWAFREEFSIHNGVLYKGERIIVPAALRKEVMSRVHASHQGEQACPRRGRDALFWPCMSQEIRDLVTSCSLCADYVPAQAKEPLMTPEPPKRPWSIVAQDLYSLEGKNFLITVDAHNGYWEVDELSQPTAANIISKTKQQFARYGNQIESTATMVRSSIVRNMLHLRIAGNLCTVPHLHITSSLMV